MTQLLNRESLLKKEDLRIEMVDLGKDEYVYVREMTGRQKDAFEKTLLKATRDEKGTVIGYESDTDDYRAKLAVVTLCDEQGNLLLQPEDYVVLSTSMSAARFDKIIAKAQQINALNEIAKEALVKNLNGDPVASSSSDSVSKSE